MSVFFTLWADWVWVVRRGPGERVREWQVRLLNKPNYGLIEVGTDVMVGDEIYEVDFFDNRKPARIFADVDWDRQSRQKRGVITWAGPSRIRQNQKEARMALNLELYGMRLLDWLYDKAGDEPGFEDVNQFVADNDLPEGSGRLLVDDLTNRGGIEPIRASGGRLDAKITAYGIGFVQKIRAERNDSVRRSRELQQRMLRWLHNQEHRGTPPPDWSDFLTSEDEHFKGDSFTLVELQREAGYLSDRNLVSGASVDQAGSGTLKPQLTADGRDCVMDFGGNVSDYLNRQQGGGTTNNITMTSSTGNIVVASESVVQNIKTGIDTRKLLEFAGFVRQVLPTLGLAEEQQANVDSDATELHEAAEAAAPDRGHLKRLTDAVMSGLTNAAPSVVTTMAIAMGNDAVQALTSH